MYDELVKRLRDAATMSEALAVLLPHSEGNATAKLYNEAANAIEELSKERKKGEWVKVFSHGWAAGWRCSECSEYSPCHYDFCPNCGAKMREES